MGDGEEQAYRNADAREASTDPEKEMLEMYGAEYGLFGVGKIDVVFGSWW